MPALRPLLFSTLGVTVAVAVVTDLRARRIPDLLTWPAMAVALALRGWGEGLGTWDTGALSGGLGLAVALGWFGAFALRKGGLGWGDVKLAGVMGAVLGLPQVLYGVIFVSLAGAAQAVVSLIWRGDLSDTVRGVLAPDPAGSPKTKRHIPYGVAIALGSLGAMWWDGNAF